MSTPTHPTLGWWKQGDRAPAKSEKDIREALHRIHEAGFALEDEAGFALGTGGAASFGRTRPKGALPVLGFVPPIRLEELGDPSFCADHGIRWPILSGSMANGISSVELVSSMGAQGLLAFFGAAGLDPETVESSIEELRRRLGDRPFGSNLIHSPAEEWLEEKIVDIYLEKSVRLVEAAAYIDLTPAIVRYRLHGIHRGRDGKVAAPNRIVAKVSRVEVAEKFFSPAPEKILRRLLAGGVLTPEQAEMAREIPMAQDLTAEADSAGHTDNRSLLELLPTMTALRDRMQAEHGYGAALRVGAAGGISTPAAAAAAFSMGAAYVLIGSVSQACTESGTSAAVREMLSQAGQADITMAPAADMFEMGVKVQVLKRGTMFAMRAGQLYDAYRSFDGIERIPGPVRTKLESEIFRAPLDEVWKDTRAFFERRDPEQVALAEKDPRHKMALVFRSYLGRASRWANAGDPARRIDYQVWCGPAMGAFNEWTRGSFLGRLENRRVVAAASNILFGAAVQLRVNALRSQGAAPPSGASSIRPLEPERIKEYLR